MQARQSPPIEAQKCEYMTVAMVRQRLSIYCKASHQQTSQIRWSKLCSAIRSSPSALSTSKQKFHILFLRLQRYYAACTEREEARHGYRPS